MRTTWRTHGGHVTYVTFAYCNFNSRLRLSVMGKRKIVHSDSEDSSGSVGEFDDQSYAPILKARTKTPSGRQPIKKKTKHIYDSDLPTIRSSNDSANPTITPPHPISTHVIDSPGLIRAALLQWYTGVHASRGMPWRKPYDPSLGPEERAQRAYEVSPLYCT